MVFAGCRTTHPANLPTPTPTTTLMQVVCTDYRITAMVLNLEFDSVRPTSEHSSSFGPQRDFEALVQTY